MHTKTLAAISLIIATTQAIAQPKVVSIVLKGPNQTNTVQLADFEYAKILTAVDTMSVNPSGFPSMDNSIELGNGVSLKAPHNPNGDIFLVNGSGGTYNGSLTGLAVAGPTTLTVRTGGSQRSGPLLVTLEILPVAYSVTNSVTLGPGQGAAIALESSPDLVQWTPTTNGVYTAASAMFFRLHLQRLQ